MEELVVKIIAEMKKQNITASKIEKELSLGDRTISHWKTGTQPTTEKLIKVIKYLNISADELFDLRQPREKKVNCSEMYFQESELKSLKIVLEKLDDNLLAHLLPKTDEEIDYDTISADIKRTLVRLMWFERYRERENIKSKANCSIGIENSLELMGQILEEVKEGNRRNKELRKEIENVKSI